MFPVDAILVPKGAEYRAVCQGLKKGSIPTPPVLTIPMGVWPLTRYLQTGSFWEGLQPQRVLLVGLCGSLTPRYRVGDAIVYQRCLYLQAGKTSEKICDPKLTAMLAARLGKQGVVGTGLTCDRVISLAAEKRDLGHQFGADVVDMEGFAALSILSQSGVAVAMLRVVSDGCDRDLPDLSTAFTPDGSLNPLPLAFGLLRHPLAATHLIQGSLRGLNKLQAITRLLFRDR